MLAENGWVRRKRQEGHFVFARERIRSCAKNSDVVFFVDRNHAGSKKLRRTVGTAHKDIGLAAVAKGLQHMGDRQNVALFVNEEAVAKEAVAVATRGWGLIQLINDGADRGGGRGVLGGLPVSDCGSKATKQTG